MPTHRPTLTVDPTDSRPAVYPVFTPALPTP